MKGVQQSSAVQFRHQPLTPNKTAHSVQRHTGSRLTASTVNSNLIAPRKSLSRGFGLIIQMMKAEDVIVGRRYSYNSYDDNGATTVTGTLASKGGGWYIFDNGRARGAENVIAPASAPIAIPQGNSSSSSSSSSSSGSNRNMSVSDEEAPSEYYQSSLSPDSPTIFTDFGGRLKSSVLGTYRENKGNINQINTSEGLATTVMTFDTGKNSAANTTALIKGPQDDGYTLVQLGTALGVKLAVSRFKANDVRFDVTSYPTVQKQWGKTSHVHTEMHIIYTLTGGDRNKIKNCLNGYILIVDKGVCGDCYPYVVSARPDEVRDSTDFYATGANQRLTWDNWQNPFDLKK
jgi:hypothetical protein